MNIYFSCSITGGRDDQQYYQAIVEYIQSAGHIVPTAHISRPDVMNVEMVVDPVDVYERDVRWVEECDAVVAEVSTPSHGVGYEIALALCQGKPVLCCYRSGKRVSKMILGNRHPNIRVVPYNTVDEILTIVGEFINCNTQPGDKSSKSCD